MSFKFNPLINMGLDNVLSSADVLAIVGGGISWKEPVDNLASLPLTGNSENDARFVKDTDELYVWSIPASSGVIGDWVQIGASVSAAWGTITGTLSDQTDLQNELDGKADTVHTHVEADITDLDKYTQTETDDLLDQKVDKLPVDFKYLLHFEGTNGDTTTTDSSLENQSITLANGASISTSDFYFGSSSLELLGGSEHLISTPSELGIYSNNLDTWTIGGKFKIDIDNGSTENIFNLFNIKTGANNISIAYNKVFIDGRMFMNWNIASNSGQSPASGVHLPADDTWTDITVIIKGDGSTKHVGLYVDGIQVSYANIPETGVMGTQVVIGGGLNTQTDENFVGYVDEFFIAKSDLYSGNPNSGITDTVTVNTSAPFEVRDDDMASFNSLGEIVRETFTATEVQTAIDNTITNTSDIDDLQTDVGNLQTDVTDLKDSAVQVPFSTEATGPAVYFEMPFAGTITEARLFADQTGDLVVDLYKDTYANFPPTVGDTITASAKPTISSGDKSEDTTLTGWTTSFAQGDIILINVDSVTDITFATLSLRITRT